jgi:FMN phosphatase YigB (HAD superfamily)
MVVCFVFDLDDTIYMHRSTIVPYDKIRPDYQLKHLLERIPYPKFILTNATFDHANTIINRLDIDDQFEKIYSRDNIQEMKPNAFCYRSVTRDIGKTIRNYESNEFIFFDDQLTNLEGAKKQGWKTVWISSHYIQSYKYTFVDKAYPSLKNALDKFMF